MASRPRRSFTSTPRVMRRKGRTSESHRNRVCKPQKSSRTIGHGVPGACTSVSDKLEALKNLIPAHIDGDIKADELFQETVDYIVLLRTQILVLQKLINFYGYPQDDQNAVQY